MTTALGIILFDDVQLNQQMLLGIAIGLSGGILYSYFSYSDMLKTNETQEVSSAYLTTEMMCPIQKGMGDQEEVSLKKSLRARSGNDATKACNIYNHLDI